MANGIKREADEAFFSKNPVEREAALRFKEAFEITFGTVYGQLSFWLANPDKHTRERFGFQQEVLVVYSPHPITDARVLTAIENITRSPDFRHRVDKVVCILVHKGSSKDTVDLVRQHRDRIIVPFHYDELMDPHRGNVFIRSTLATHIGAIDLFGFSSPITSDRYFFGRDELVQTLMSRTVLNKENAGLFGLRKTGKTSALFAIQRRLQDRAVLAEYVECENPGIHAGRWWQVLDNLIIKLRDTLKREHKREASIDAGYSQHDAGTRFVSDIKLLLKNGHLDHLLIMLDEIEHLTPGLSGRLGAHWDEDFVPFWQTIRATHQETKSQLTFVVAGVNPTCVEQSHFGQIVNPIFQLAKPHYLEPLSVDSVREMVRSIGRYSGLNIEPRACAYLHEAYGGHPYLIRVACSEVLRKSDTSNPHRITVVDEKAFHDITPLIRARLAGPIRDILLSLVWWYPEEYELLQLLAEGEGDFVREYLRSRPESVLQFARYGLLKEDTGDFAIGDLKAFLKEQGNEYKQVISPFTRGDVPPGLLPDAPDLAVLSKLFEKRSEIEIKLRKAIVLYLGVKFSWDNSKISEAVAGALRPRQDRPNPKQLFVGRSPQDAIHELYTMDLKLVVLHNWEVFAPLFDNKKVWFEMNMDTLNKARRVDAHAKSFSADERIEIETSYGWLLGKLAKIP